MDAKMPAAVTCASMSGVTMALVHDLEDIRLERGLQALPYLC